VNEPALSCALGALRDGVEGVITWGVEDNMGWSGENGYLVILEDRAVVVRDAGHLDEGSWISDAVHGTLPASAHFEACLAEPDPWARFDCFRVAPREPQTVCEAGI